MMKRIMALTLAGALSASMATAAFASDSDDPKTVDSDAGIAFEPGEPGIIDPGVPPVGPGNEKPPVTWPEIPGIEKPGPGDPEEWPDVSDFTSIGLEFGMHPIPLIATRYKSMEASQHPAKDGNGTVTTEYLDNSADMFILAYDKWTVTAEIKEFKLSGTTIKDFDLWLVPRTDVTNPVIALGEKGDITLVDVDPGNNVFANSGNGAISPGTGAKKVANGNAGLFGARFAGVLDIAKGQVTLDGSAKAELIWTLTQAQPTA